MRPEWLETGAYEALPSDATTDDRRRVRWAARSWLWKNSSKKPVQACGRCRRADVSMVKVRQDPATQRGGYAGLQSCGQLWVCTVCNAKIMTARALDIGASVERWLTDVPDIPARYVLRGKNKGKKIADAVVYERGLRGRLVFTTWTVRHNRAQGIDVVWKNLTQCWSHMASGRGWEFDRRTYGVGGHLRITECTHGCNGWHAHFHAILYIEPTQGGDLEDLRISMQSRWADKAQALGCDVVEEGFDWQVVQYGDVDKLSFYLSRYVSKSQYNGGELESRMKLGQELTNSQSKQSRSALATRSTWSILHDARMGIDGALELWHAWEKHSHRKKFWTWADGFRARLAMGEEVSNEELAAQELGTDDDTVAVIHPDGWVRMVKLHLMIPALEVLESGGRAALGRFLAENGIWHELVQ